MAERKKNNTNQLSTRMVRNNDIFCCLLINQTNKSIRVIDFRGGNFQLKHNYLERILLADGMRKIFTLIERDDMSGWSRVGYHREGTIPGYYKRSDAYIMARIYDDDWEGIRDIEDQPERKNILNEAKILGNELTTLKASGLKAEHVAEEEISDLLKKEFARLAQKASRAKKTKGAKTTSFSQVIEDPVFPQFSRETDNHFFICSNRRTKQINLFGAEYQGCFGNAKMDLFFKPKSRTDLAIARHGLNSFIDWLEVIGAVAIFSLVRADDLETNALFFSAGFRNSGWMHRQLITREGPIDQILWTKKLTV
jgi:hypothetical protein